MESFPLQEKCYLALPSFRCPHGQILIDGRAGIFRIKEKNVFLGKQWDQQEKEVKSDPRKLSDPRPDQREKQKMCKMCYTYQK